ncbi:MAG TPA: hypothetical protein VLS89_06045 [Candidatus Nanopelagicales bacterium]|nr:hypothetical protein [Candidatus Nanopelagicales bacterium]
METETPRNGRKRPSAFATGSSATARAGSRTRRRIPLVPHLVNAADHIEDPFRMDKESARLITLEEWRRR